MIAAVLFDLDGTLVDSRADIAAAANRALAESGYGALDLATVQGFIGHGATHLVTRSLEAAGAPTDATTVARLQALFLQRYGEHLVDRTVPYPGVRDTLRALRAAGIATGVVTNKPAAPARALLELLELGPFDVVLGGDSVATRKPDPLPLSEALARLEVARADALFVGDSTIDLATARAASVAFVAVGYGIGSADELRREGADPILDRLDALLELVGVAPGPRA